MILEPIRVVIGIAILVGLGVLGWFVYRYFVKGTYLTHDQLVERIDAVEKRIMEKINPTLIRMDKDANTLREMLDKHTEVLQKDQGELLVSLRRDVTGIQNRLYGVLPQVEVMLNNLRADMVKRTQEIRANQRTDTTNVFAYIRDEIAVISDKIAFVDKQIVDHVVQMHNNPS